MSLLTSQMEPFVKLKQQTVQGNEGGFRYTAVADSEFPANSRLDGSLEKKSAQKENVAAVYTITTARSVTLRYHDVVQRLSDGVCFRVLSNGNDNRTPDCASLDMRQVSAEEWRVPK